MKNHRMAARLILRSVHGKGLRAASGVMPFPRAVRMAILCATDDVWKDARSTPERLAETVARWSTTHHREFCVKVAGEGIVHVKRFNAPVDAELRD